MLKKETIENFKNRYFRKVIAYPDGAIVHHGDCLIYSDIEIVCDKCLETKQIKNYCDCGLLKDLMILSDEDIKELKSNFKFGVIKGFRDFDISPETENEIEWNNKFGEYLKITRIEDSSDKNVEEKIKILLKEMDELSKLIEKEEKLNKINYDGHEYRFFQVLYNKYS